LNWKLWSLIGATSLFLACGQKNDNTNTNKPPTSGASQGAPSDPHPDNKTTHSEPDEPDDPKIVVHLMHRFTLSLSEKPTNAEPSPDWQSLLADPANPITCADCHANGKMMAEKFDGTVRPEGTETWEKNNQYMKVLMGKWMKRANEKARAKLKSDLKCTSCHAKVPS
jgi:hypothetical protein